MMQPLDPVCLDAFARLLERPDPVDLPRRGHVCRFDGDPDRRATRLPGILMAWLQRRYLEIDGDDVIDAGQPQATRLQADARCPELEANRRGPSRLSLVARRPDVRGRAAAVARVGGSR